MSEISLADFLPLWRTVREEEVTSLITPALDYVGALELTTVDARLAGVDAIQGLGEQLRSVIASADDGWNLQFLYRVTTDCDSDIRDYEVSAQRKDDQRTPPALQEYVRARVSWLKQQPLRKTRLFLFFSRRNTAATHTALGIRMWFAKLDGHSAETHRGELTALRSIRNALKSRLETAGIGVRELGIGDVHAVMHSLLNPTHAEKRWPPPDVRVRDNLFAEEALRKVGDHLREYTEAEQLCLEDIVEERDALRQESTWRRAMTLKQLPEGGTGYLSVEHIADLVEPNGQDVIPFPFWLSVSVNIEHQGKQRLKLNTAHNLVGLVTDAVPFLKTRSASREAADRSQLAGIEGLFEEVSAMASKIVTLSMGILIDAPSREALDIRTEAARAAFAKAGNSELMLEEVSQLPAFLSILPGAGPFQHRKKTCTSRNAADFLPVIAPWTGCSRASSLLWTPKRDVFRFDFFDPRLPAHHGLVWADTGSGKSVALGAFTLDALASGHDAILVDNGRSWQRFTELLGGIHVNVDIRTAITPFLPWSQVVASDGGVDAEAVEEVVSFLELCVRDVDLPEFNKLQTRLVASAVRQVYETRFKSAPEERPLMHHFRDAIRSVGEAKGTHADDRAIADSIYRRLGLFVGDEQYGRFLDRPSSLRFDAPLVCFEMEGVAKGGAAKSIAFATVMRAITARAAAGRKRGVTRRTLVEIDEGHTWLGQDETAERFLETCYRVMRKYGVAMWMVSQGLEDFQSVKAGRAILGNSALKFLLYAAAGHRSVANFFGLTPRAEEAFTRLERKPGHFSDFLMLYGQRRSTVRLALHPLALWLLTTAPTDKHFIAAAQRKNPHLSEFEVLLQLAKHYPHGAPDGFSAPSNHAA